MKNARALSLFAFFLAVLLFMPALAKAESFQVRVVVQDAVVRLKPEANSPVISTMPLGSVLESEEGTADWYKVTLPPDENGFVVIGYIQKSDTEMVSAAPVKQKQVAPARIAQPVVTSPQPQMPQVAPRPKGFGGMEFGIRAFGGGAMLFGTDHLDKYWADYIAFEDDYYTWAWGPNVIDIDGDLSPLNFGLSGGMEVFFNLNPYIGFGLGGGFITGSKESFVEYLDTDWGDDWDETFTRKIAAPYFQFTVYGGIPVGNMFRVMPYAGVGVYMGTLTFEYIDTYRDPFFDYDYSYDETWKAKSSAFGFHGGLNFEIYFTRNIGLFLGGGVIMATFKELVGDIDWNGSDSDGWSDSDTDTDQQLWFYEEEGWSTSNWYANTSFSQNEPSTESWRRNVEPGFFSLTQFRFVMGIVIYLMR